MIERPGLLCSFSSSFFCGEDRIDARYSGGLCTVSDQKTKRQNHNPADYRDQSRVSTTSHEVLEVVVEGVGHLVIAPALHLTGSCLRHGDRCSQNTLVVGAGWPGKMKVFLRWLSRPRKARSSRLPDCTRNHVVTMPQYCRHKMVFCCPALWFADFVRSLLSCDTKQSFGDGGSCDVFVQPCDMVMIEP